MDLPAALALFPSGFGLLVAGNGSTDGTATLAAASSARMVDKPGRGFGAARRADLPAVAGPITARSVAARG